MADMLTVTVGTTDYTFDWVAQHIHIESGVTEITADDLKTAIHDAQDDEVAMPFPQIAEFFNPVTLTTTSATFLNVVLQDQWRIESLSSSGTLTVGDGNVVNVNNGIDIFVPNALVSMVNNTSAAGVLVSGAGSGLTAEQDTILTKLHQAHFNRRYWDKVGNTITIYDSDKTTPLYLFDTNSDMSDITPADPNNVVDGADNVVDGADNVVDG